MNKTTGDSMISLQRIHTSLVLVVILLAVAFSGSASAEPYAGDMLRSPYGGQIRALVIGIDAYQHVRQLKGATADAQDIDASLKKAGVRDVTTLLDAAADRSSVLAAIYGLLQRTGPRDVVIISLAGHGAREPDRVGGAHEDGLEDVFLLAGFEDTPAGSQERILGAEFNHFIKQFEERGAHVLFVADTCYGGGMTRSIDPRWQQMSFRHVPSYRLSEDTLKPVATTQDETANQFDFQHTAFLAAVDDKTMAPEVEIPGIAGLRGALSYAVAREIEDSANNRGPDKTTLKDLFSNVRQIVYQLSNERQNIIATASADESPNTPVFERVRSINVVSSPPSSARSDGSSGGTQQLAEERPIKIAPLNGNKDDLLRLKPLQAEFKVVAPVDYPDLTWDSASHDVLAWGDVVAYGVEPADLPNVIDRTKAVRDLKSIADKTPQPIKVSPDDGLHRDSAVVQIEVSHVAGRALILFDIEGDGSVELLYPVGADPHVIKTADYVFPVRVKKPFGSDQLVAVTSDEPMPALEQALEKLDKRRAALEAVEMLKRSLPADARIGSAGLFTAP